MAFNRIVCRTDPHTVFAVLSDPRIYRRVVVGTRAIRRFDPDWPDPGSAFDHSLGLGVTLVRDRTEVLAVTPGARLELRAGMRPWAVNNIAFQLAAHEAGTLVEMTEAPVAGLAAAPGLRLVTDWLLRLRNRQVLRRLRAIAEARARRAVV